MIRKRGIRERLSERCGRESKRCGRERERVSEFAREGGVLFERE